MKKKKHVAKWWVRDDAFCECKDCDNRPSNTPRKKLSVTVVKRILNKWERQKKVK